MPQSLSKAAVQDFRRDGYYFPLPALSASEVAYCRERLETHEAKVGAPLQGNFRHKSHLLFTWVDALVHHPNILDPVETILGPNLLCWTTNFFIKEANSPGFVSWHQDAFYWGLSKDDVVTAWVALSPANLESGCMKFVPGSQTAGSSPPRRHVPQGQLAVARAGDRRQDRHRENCRLHSHPGRNVAAPREGGARIRAQPLERPAHRAGDPLHPHRRQAAQGARTRRRWCAASTTTAISITSRGPSATSTTRRWPRMPTRSGGR